MCKKFSSSHLFILFFYLLPLLGATNWLGALPNPDFLVFSKNPLFSLHLTQRRRITHWEKLFQTRYAKRFRIWLERSQKYVPLMKHIFETNNLPLELVYLAMIESGFSAKALSSAGALGYWQFMYKTGTRFGLRKSSWFDERMDFEKSTFAASQYLKFLYRKFGDWYLALAAYNMGENRLSGFIKKYKTRDFWQLAQKYDFPKETAHYVPQFIATIKIVKNPRHYGFKRIRVRTPHHFEVFHLKGGINLRALAFHIDESFRHIQALNPSLLCKTLPLNIDSWPLRIPKGTSFKVTRYLISLKTI